MDIRDKKLMEYAMANAEKNTQLSEKAESVIDYNVMMGKLDDPEEQEAEND